MKNFHNLNLQGASLMKKLKNNIVRVTLEEARKIKSQSNPAQIICQQEREDIRDSQKEKGH